MADFHYLSGEDKLIVFDLMPPRTFIRIKDDPPAVSRWIANWRKSHPGTNPRELVK